MDAGLTGVDHVVIAFRDLDQARQNWTRLGFALTPCGRHGGPGAANDCIMFASEHLKLLGSPGPNHLRERLGRFLSHREGPIAVAFAAGAAPEEMRAALLRRQLHPSEEQELERRVGLPEDDGVLRFSLMSLPPQETPGLDSFICRDITPESIRRPEWVRHPNGAVGLTSIHVLVENTAALLEPYDRLFGIQQVTTTDAVVRVEVGRHRIVFSTPDDFSAIHPALHLGQGFQLPGIAALELGVQSIENTADRLSGLGVAFKQMPAGDLAVGANAANGAILFFFKSEPALGAAHPSLR